MINIHTIGTMNDQDTNQTVEMTEMIENEIVTMIEIEAIENGIVIMMTTNTRDDIKLCTILE